MIVVNIRRHPSALDWNYSDKNRACREVLELLVLNSGIIDASKCQGITP